MLWGPNEQELAQDASLEQKRKIRIVKQRNGVLLTIELDFKNEIQLFETITEKITF
jgi:replicative DNA helicase